MSVGKLSASAALAVLSLGGALAQANTIGVSNQLLKPDVGGSANITFTGTNGNGTLAIVGRPGLLTRETGPSVIATGGAFSLNATLVNGIATAAELRITFDPSGAVPLSTWFYSDQLLNSGFGSSPFPTTFEFVFGQQAPASPFPAFAMDAPQVGSLIGVTVHNTSTAPISFASSFTLTSFSFDAAPVAAPAPSAAWGAGTLVGAMALAKLRQTAKKA